VYGISVRLAFHDAADMDQSTSDTLGSDGCLSDDIHNAGLVEGNSLVNTLLEPIWQRTCDRISRGDFWVLFAKLVLEKADPTHSMRVAYHFGRRDVTNCNAAIGR
jgi:catalase (peroxidase I)